MQMLHTTISEICTYFEEKILNVILKKSYHNLFSLINRFGNSGRFVGFSGNIVVLITVSFSDLICWGITLKL